MILSVFLDIFQITSLTFFLAGVPAQLIVSSGNSQKPVTVQQIHQIKGQPAQGQQLIPHNILKAGQGSTVQARVIPATVAGRPQQIHVVAAPASAAAAAAGNE